LDVLLRKVHEKIEGVCSTKGKTRGLYGRGVHNIGLFYYANEYIKQIDDTPKVVVWDDQHDEDKREGELPQMNKKGT
jgi:hypothetical protein